MRPGWRAIWGLPNTVVGLLCALLSLARPRWVDGVLVVESRRGFAHLFLTRRRFAAVTLGRVIITTVPITPALWRHELEHVRQSERWGPCFIPLYLYLYLRKGYWNHPFEVAARRAEMVAGRDADPSRDDRAPEGYQIP
ncbi:MAG TPA: hypothetical protein VIN09_06505 [Chloroflexota bacterium]